MYSQGQEEKYILEYFKEVADGNFMDIGAYHPFTFSNTRALYEKGWGGIMFEPSPICFKNLEKEYTASARVTLHNLAVSDCEGDYFFYEEAHGHAVSTLSPAHMLRWKDDGVFDFNKIKVPTISVHSIEAEYSAPDFLSIDAEDLSFHILSSFSAEFLRKIKMICVEYEGYDQQIIARLASLGFKKLLMNGENLILAQ